TESSTSPLTTLFRSPECDALIHAAYAVCPECGHKFPPRQVKHAAIASDEEVVTGSEGPARRDERVIEVAYYVHHKRNDPLAKPRSEEHTSELQSREK